MVLKRVGPLKNNMGNSRTTGQDFIDYYENKKKRTGKTTASENKQYYKEKQKQKNAAIQQLLN